LPALHDPVILERRSRAAPLWNDGLSARTIQPIINTWLESINELPVSLDTLYGDHRAIADEWKASYAGTVEECRIERVANLNRIKSKAWEGHDRAIAAGMSTAPYLDLVRKTEMDLARLQGVEAPVKVDVSTSWDRLAAALAIEIPPEDLRVIPLLDNDEEWSNYRELPPPAKRDS
jgi:hypothetical protein